MGSSRRRRERCAEAPPHRLMQPRDESGRPISALFLDLLRVIAVPIGMV
jgi:hypothetical protein